MISNKTLTLPLARELQSNKLTDIQEFLDRLIDRLEKAHRRLWQDIQTIQIPATGFIYFGGKDTLGTFRLGRIGADYVLQHQTTTIGTWVTIDLAKGS